MKGILHGIVLSIQFLTRIPIPVTIPWEARSIKGALMSFVIVGYIIGGCLATTLYIMENTFPPYATTFTLLSLWVFLTGGLHLDGLMDVVDALGSNASLTKKHEIMKDPHVGSFSVVALFFHLGWKAIFLHVIITSNYLTSAQLALVLLFIPACSRLFALFLLYKGPLIKQEGLAYEWKRYLSGKEVLIASSFLFIPLLIQPMMVGLLVSYLILFFVASYRIHTTFQGINGDIVGAAIEGGELWGLTVLSMFILFVTG
ncbi:adenosylcobinamide-GDP ribazoletransferase [Bacillus weihaiensis]|uniref:adenosylcobinamide-GDP ribazoletransferase n=1 Tax=Bacillus weihaiensis TaxID=1547283 RepID=UPI002353F3EF|nr:adenosylcobinamide-GDP ribazoletransferase [Bacillus weihaiensis]